MRDIFVACAGVIIASLVIANLQIHSIHKRLYVDLMDIQTNLSMLNAQQTTVGVRMAELALMLPVMQNLPKAQPPLENDARFKIIPIVHTTGYADPVFGECTAWEQIGDAYQKQCWDDTLTTYHYVMPGPLAPCQNKAWDVQ